MSKDKKDVVIYFVSKVIIGVISLVTVTLYSRLLNPDEYGEYSLIAGLVSALIAIFIGWIGSSALRYYIDYSKDKSEKTRFYSNVIMYTVVMIIAMIAILFIISLLSNVVPINKYLIATIIFTVSLSFMEVFEKIFRASQKTVIYAISMVFQVISNIVIFYILVKFEIGANSVLYSTALSKIIFVIISIITLKVLFHFNILTFDKQLLKRFLKFGIPMIGVWGISWILSYCDRYIIALFYEDYDVGIYDMSYKIAENSINVIITSFTLAVYPILIKVFKNEGKEKLELKIKSVIKYFFILTIPSIVGLSLIVNKLYLSVIDMKYYSGRYIIALVCIGMMFNGFNAILNKTWQLKEKTKNIFYVMLVTVIINIILNMIFIPMFGIIAAAVTTLVSYFISNVITFIFIRKDFRLMIDYKSLIKTIISCTVMASFLIWFNRYVNGLLMMIVEIIIAVLIYGLMSIILKNISVKEVLNLKNENK